jgi:hypothetical protein
MTTRPKTLPVLLASILTLAAGGCATVFNGTRQKIEVVSEPPGATASALGQQVTTPGILVLPRKAQALEIKVEKEGYEARTIALRRVTSGLVYLDFIAIPAGIVGGAAAGAGLSNDHGWFAGWTEAAYGAAAGGVGLSGAAFAIDYTNGSAYRLEPGKVVVRLEALAPAQAAAASGEKEP